MVGQEFKDEWRELLRRTCATGLLQKKCGLWLESTLDSKKGSDCLFDSNFFLTNNVKAFRQTFLCFCGFDALLEQLAVDGVNVYTLS